MTWVKSSLLCLSSNSWAWIGILLLQNMKQNWDYFWEMYSYNGRICLIHHHQHPMRANTERNHDIKHFPLSKEEQSLESHHRQKKNLPSALNSLTQWWRFEMRSDAWNLGPWQMPAKITHLLPWHRALGKEEQTQCYQNSNQSADWEGALVWCKWLFGCQSASKQEEKTASYLYKPSVIFMQQCHPAENNSKHKHSTSSVSEAHYFSELETGKSLNFQTQWPEEKKKDSISFQHAQNTYTTIP